MQVTEAQREHPLARLVRERGIKKQWVAEQMGWDRSVVTRCIQGTRELTASEVVRLAAIFDVAPETFLPEVA